MKSPLYWHACMCGILFPILGPAGAVPEAPEEQKRSWQQTCLPLSRHESDAVAHLQRANREAMELEALTMETRQLHDEKVMVHNTEEEAMCKMQILEEESMMRAASYNDLTDHRIHDLQVVTDQLREELNDRHADVSTSESLATTLRATLRETQTQIEVLQRAERTLEDKLQTSEQQQANDAQQTTSIEKLSSKHQQEVHSMQRQLAGARDNYVGEQRQCHVALEKSKQLKTKAENAEQYGEEEASVLRSAQSELHALDDQMHAAADEVQSLASEFHTRLEASERTIRRLEMSAAQKNWRKVVGYSKVADAFRASPLPVQSNGSAAVGEGLTSPQHRDSVVSAASSTSSVLHWGSQAHITAARLKARKAARASKIDVDGECQAELEISDAMLAPLQDTR